MDLPAGLSGFELGPATRTAQPERWAQFEATACPCLDSTIFLVLDLYLPLRAPGKPVCFCRHIRRARALGGHANLSEE
jgi:hypothetical protein